VSNWVETLIFRRLKQRKFVKFSESDTKGVGLCCQLFTKSGISSNATTDSSSGQCGLQVNMPHASSTYSEEIHTRINSFCKVLPLASNTVSGKTCRLRWYGWQLRATLPPKTVYASSSTVQNYRRTVVAKCKEGTWHRYRTEEFGTVVTAQGQSLC
jgi:hypothetical protein